MGIMVKKITKSAIAGVTMTEVFEGMKKVTKKDGLMFLANDYAMGNSATYGRYIALINTESNEFMYAPASSFDTIDATIDTMGVDDFNNAIKSGCIFKVIESTSKSGRNYFTLEF